ncbi:MAG TPA: c-type cytochrome [Thermoanaerobaculia bacterium]
MRILRLGAALVVLVAAAAGIYFWSAVRRGFSAREAPGAAEAFVAARLRRWSVPSEVRRRSNPLTAAPDAIAAGRAHFADHCAICHANDGSGGTEMGRNMYPRAPDMRSAHTQQLSDGEIFGIIKNGIRLTGMPAWGSDTPADDAATWQLVAFIRHLPRITDAELAEMKKLNPISPQEMAEKREEEEFLSGGETSSSAESGKKTVGPEGPGRKR